MTARSELLLGVIAAATLLIAIVQIGVIVIAGILARRLSRLVDQFEQDVRPLFGHLNAIGRDASRAAALAAAQVDRADQVLADFASRIEQMLQSVQEALGTPAREWRAILSAFRAGFDAIRETRPHAGPRPAASEDDEALFI